MLITRPHPPDAFPQGTHLRELTLACLPEIRRLENLNPERWLQELKGLDPERRFLVESYFYRNKERRQAFIELLLGDSHVEDHSLPSFSQQTVISTSVMELAR